MKKVGQPPLALFEKANQWYESRARTQAFSSAIKQASALTADISASDRAKVLRGLQSSVKSYESNTLKLQKALSQRLQKHFLKRGINIGSVIRLSYPVYGEATESGVPRIVDAVIKVVAFNYQPKDEKNPEPRFRVIGRVAVNHINEFAPEDRYFPLDKYCSFEQIA